ncbi:MAG: hypothetical protein V2I66_10970 [Halieaceae bacterium]|jgi:hypothetical protein|nr:hypothetical protein [Halieaceae bacterium]
MRKNLLVVALLGFACATEAVVDLDSPSPDTPRYARETLDSRLTTPANLDGSLLYNVVDAGTNNDVQTVLGVGIPADDRVFLRFQLEGGVLAEGNNIRLTVNGSDAGILLSLGGNIGDNYVVYIVDAPSGLAASATVLLELDTLAISQSGPVAFTYSAHETLTDAVFSGTSLYSNTLGSYITTVEGASPGIQFRENTADVSTGFTAFTSASVGRTRANIGTFDYAENAAARSAATGGAVVLQQVVNEAASQVTLRGDFSFGSWYLDDNEDCTSADVDLSAAVESGDGSTLVTGFGNFGSQGFIHLCVEVGDEGQEVQPAEYEVESEPIATNVFALFDPVRVDGSLGLIDRNGVEVNLPSLTTFGEYQQRLTLVNYRDIEVAYSISFVTEEGVTATALEQAEGVIGPNQKLVLSTEDIVSLEGGTRCAANLQARSRPGTLGISTTQVNLADGSTDTVVYQ